MKTIATDINDPACQSICDHCNKPVSWAAVVGKSTLCCNCIMEAFYVIPVSLFEVQSLESLAPAKEPQP